MWKESEPMEVNSVFTVEAALESTGRTTGGKGRSESVQSLWKATGRGRCILHKLWNKNRRR